MSKELEHKIRDVIMTVQEVVAGHSTMAKRRIINVAVRRIMDLIEDEKKGKNDGK
jgi:hypothetical protein